jgi:hypothetical protein
MQPHFAFLFSHVWPHLNQWQKAEMLDAFFFCCFLLTVEHTCNIKVCRIWGMMRPHPRGGFPDGQRFQTLESALGSGWRRRLPQSKVSFQSLRWFALTISDPYLFFVCVCHQLILITTCYEDYAWGYSPWTGYKHTHHVCWDRYKLMSIAPHFFFCSLHVIIVQLLLA